VPKGPANLQKKQNLRLDLRRSRTVRDKSVVKLSFGDNRIIATVAAQSLTLRTVAELEGSNPSSALSFGRRACPRQAGALGLEPRGKPVRV